jgi:phosphodiesterase/alkaline phosphatase D-like protein
VPPRHPTRRDILRAAGVLALPSCGDNLYAIVPIVATLEVTPTSALIVAWSGTGDTATATVHDDQTGDRVAEVDAPIGPGEVAHLDVTGLQPARRYRYRVRGGGAHTRDFRFTTAPDVGDPRPVRIAFSADLDPDPILDSPILDTMIDEAADLYVSLGDWPYADNPPGATTLPEYRARHLEARGADKVQRWLATVGVRAIYDDHEVGNNWDAEISVADPARLAAALTAWDEWFPVRGAPPEARYRSWRWGASVECFLLDCRRYRDDDEAPDVAGKIMIGDAQRAWLLAGLAASTAPFKLVFTSVPLDFGWGVDHWAGYTHERELILRGIRDAGITGVLFLSADQHWFASHVHRYGARELQVGPLARGPFDPPPPVPGVIARANVYNFGLLDATPEVLRFVAVGARGERLYEEEMTPEGLRLR